MNKTSMELFPDIKEHDNTDFFFIQNEKPEVVAAVACEDCGDVGYIHINILKEFRTREVIDNLKSDLFPEIIKELSDKHKILSTTISPDNIKTKKLMEEMGFEVVTTTIGILNLQER